MNVAQKAGKRYLPKVADAVFKYNGSIAFVAKANTSSEVNIQTTMDQIRAGQNNVVIGTVLSEKTIDVNFQTPEWRIEFLAANIGETITIGNVNFTVTDIQLAAVSGVITLPDVPVDGVIYIDAVGRGDYVKVTATTKEVDLTAYGVTGNACVNVIGCFEKTGKRVNLSASTSPLVGELILESPIFEGTKGEVGKSQYVFPAFSLSGNWDHNFGSDVSYEISGTAVATASAVCGEGDSYGYYQETYLDDSEINDFEYIHAVPSAIELGLDGTATIEVYGVRSGLYAKTKIDADVTFASSDSTVATVGATTGVVTAAAVGTTYVTVTYGELTDVVSVEVSNS